MMKHSVYEVYEANIQKWASVQRWHFCVSQKALAPASCIFFDGLRPEILLSQNISESLHSPSIQSLSVQHQYRNASTFELSARRNGSRHAGRMRIFTGISWNRGRPSLKNARNSSEIGLERGLCCYQTEFHPQIVQATLGNSQPPACLIGSHRAEKLVDALDIERNILHFRWADTDNRKKEFLVSKNVGRVPLRKRACSVQTWRSLRADKHRIFCDTNFR